MVFVSIPHKDSIMEQIPASTKIDTGHKEQAGTDTQENPLWQGANMNNENNAEQRTTQEIATNDGAVIETLDTALHNTPGVTEGENISGSNRADYYESRSNGKTDSEEELEALNNKKQDK